MKWVVGTIIALALAGAAVLFLWPKAKFGAEPFAFGRDSCAYCRMHIARSGFGGELRDPKGNLTKYDDIGCMLLAMNRAHREFQEIWVEDHAGSGFIHLLSATLVRGRNLGTPMEYDVLAFKDPETAAKFARERKSEVVSLEVLLKDKERFAPKKEPHP